MPKLKLPEVVKILHSDYKLIEDTIINLEGDYGRIDYLKKNIRYQKLDGPENVDSILHEVLHGVVKVMGTMASNDEEHIVSTIASGLTTVMRDNPSLFPVLQKMVNEK